MHSELRNGPCLALSNSCRDVNGPCLTIELEWRETQGTRHGGEGVQKGKNTLEEWVFIRVIWRNIDEVPPTHTYRHMNLETSSISARQVIAASKK